MTITMQLNEQFCLILSLDRLVMLSSRSRVGLFLNRRLTWVAECFDREDAAWDVG